MKHSLVLGTLLFGIWILWSGHYTPLLLSLGGVSCLLVIFLARRMNLIDQEGVPLQLGLRPFTHYAPWLFKEIVLANIDVACRILTPSLPIRPRMIRIKSSQKGDLGRVIFANSITLTPGTVSVDLVGNEFVVHALTEAAAADDASGEMDRRVTALEE